jgi:excisionase family DNA binding protein
MPPDREFAATPARSLTVAEVARRYRVSSEKVRTWIARGELPALNTADARRAKPRWVVTPEALEQFERGRLAATAPPKAMKRRRRQTGTIDFYPD